MNKIASLKDCCSFQEGYVNPSQKNREYFGGNIKWLRASDLTGFFVNNTEKTLSQKGFESAGTSAFLFKKDTLAISKSGTIGSLGILKDEMCGNRAVINIDVDKTKADLYYIFYLLKYKNKELIAKANGSIQKNLYISALETTKVNHSDLPTQQKIAAALSALDAKIELNKRINAQLESLAKTLFDYWFVQHSRTSKWKTGKLGDFIQINERNITKEYPYDEIEYIDIASVSVGHLEGTTQYSLKDAPSRARRLVKHGDTIWSTVRPNRKSYLFIYKPKDNLVASTGFAVLTPKKVPSAFLYFFTTTDQFCNYLVSNAEGSAYPAVSADRFAEIDFSIPPENELIKFEKIVSPMLAKMAQNELESQALTELRDWLLPMLMNGQVTIVPSESVSGSNLVHANDDLPIPFPDVTS